MSTFLLFLLVVVAGAQAHTQPNCRDLLDFDSRVVGHVTDVSKVRTDRRLMDYLARLPSEFADELLGLGAEDHWIDMGSGDGLAIAEYTGELPQDSFVPGYYRRDESRIQGVFDALARKEPASRARATGITHSLKQSLIFISAARFLTGRLLEDIPHEEIGRGRIITDVMGIFAYAAHKDEVLARFLDLLDENGSIYIDFGNMHFDPGLLASKVTKEDGTELSLLEWLGSIPGLDVQTYKMPFFARPWGYERPISVDEVGVRIRIKNRSDLKIPKLKFDHAWAHLMPATIQYSESTILDTPE